VRDNRAHPREFKSLHGSEFPHAGQKRLKIIAVPRENVGPLFLLRLECLGILVVDEDLYEVVSLGIAFVYHTKDNTVFTEYVLDELDSSRGHLDIILAFKVDPELRNDDQIFLAAVAEFEVLSFLALWLVVYF